MARAAVLKRRPESGVETAVRPSLRRPLRPPAPSFSCGLKLATGGLVGDAARTAYSICDSLLGCSVHGLQGENGQILSEVSPGGYFVSIL